LVVSESQTSGVTRVGVIGAGQLARMMGEVASSVGVSITVLAHSLDEAAVATCDHVVLGDATDPLALDALARSVDVVTFDHELVSLDQIAELEHRGVVVRPSARALRFAVDKAYQRRALFEAGVPVPRFVVVTGASDSRLMAFLDERDEPPVIKIARGGYDGRGVFFPVDREEALRTVERLGVEVVVEERLALESEVAQLMARGVDGTVVLYPLVTTVQSDAMCAEVRFPAEVTRDVEIQATQLGQQLASLINVVGLLAIEFFVTSEGLVVNEVALRPHNSGHWTIEGAATSQFENHLLAVSGQALGAATPTARCAVMVNIVGPETPSNLEAALRVDGVHVHDYGKSWRPGRKLAHVTALGDDVTSVHVQAWKGARAYGTRTRET